MTDAGSKTLYFLITFSIVNSTVVPKNPKNIYLKFIFARNESLSLSAPGYVHHSDIETSLKFYNDRLNWYNAGEKCKSDGGRLAVVDTRTKLKHVKALRPPLTWVWVGIYRQPSLNEWQAIDGSQLDDDLPWAPLNPKQFFGDCVATNGFEFAFGLSNWDCNIAKAFVCEIPDLNLM